MKLIDVKFADMNNRKHKLYTVRSNGLGGFMIVNKLFFTVHGGFQTREEPWSFLEAEEATCDNAFHQSGGSPPAGTSNDSAPVDPQEQSTQPPSRGVSIDPHELTAEFIVKEFHRLIEKANRHGYKACALDLFCDGALDPRFPFARRIIDVYDSVSSVDLDERNACPPIPPKDSPDQEGGAQ